MESLVAMSKVICYIRYLPSPKSKSCSRHKYVKSWQLKAHSLMRSQGLHVPDDIWTKNAYKIIFNSHLLPPDVITELFMTL